MIKKARNNNGYKKIKVCHVATVAGSLYVLLLNQLRFIKDKCGYEVHGAAYDDKWAKNFQAKGFPMHLISLKRKISPFNDIKAFVQLYLLFKKEKFDIVHVHTPKAALLGSLAAWIARIPIRINTIHGFYFHENSSKLKYFFFWCLEVIISRCVHYALSQNREDYSLALRTHLYKRGCISFLGNGIDINRFKPNPNLKSSVRLELSIPVDSFVMGMVGRLTNEKGHREFLKALRVLAKNGYPIMGIIFGSSEGRNIEYYLKLSREMGIEDRVKYFGWYDNIERIYCAFDVYVLPSYREGFPRSAMEACACGIPCILTNIRGCREVVRDSINGFLVPVRNVRLLVKKIELLLSDSNLRRKIGVEARRETEKKFDEREVFQKVAKTYEILLEEKFIQ